MIEANHEIWHRVAQGNSVLNQNDTVTAQKAPSDFELPVRPKVAEERGSVGTPLD